MDDKALETAKRKALKLISRKKVLTREVVDLLTEEGLSQDLIEDVVKEWQRFGYLDDDDWIKTRVEMQKSRKKGPKAIFYKLREKHLPPELIEEKLKEHYSEEEQVEKLSLYIKKKLGSTRSISDQKDRAKIINACLRQGFDLDLIIDTLKNFAN